MRKKARKVAPSTEGRKPAGRSFKAGGGFFGLDLSPVGEASVGQFTIRMGPPPLPHQYRGWVAQDALKHPQGPQLGACAEFKISAASTEEAFLATQAGFRELTLALRLSKGGQLWAPPEFLYVEVEGRAVRLGREIPNVPSTPLDNPYILTPEDILTAERLLADIIALHPYSDCHFEIALDRFDQSYERSSPVDRFIDLIVALEALISEPEAIGYKVALRSALLTKDTLEDRRAVRDLIKTAYDKRSRVLHGEKADRQWLEENIEHIEGAVRTVIGSLLRIRRSGHPTEPSALDDLLILSQGLERTDA